MKLNNILVQSGTVPQVMLSCSRRCCSCLLLLLRDVMMMVMEEVMQRSSARANQRHRLGRPRLPGYWRSNKTNDLQSVPGQS